MSAQLTPQQQNIEDLMKSMDSECCNTKSSAPTEIPLEQLPRIVRFMQADITRLSKELQNLQHQVIHHRHDSCGLACKPLSYA